MTTIIDVAKAAGVSTATVSRVINSPKAVRKQTRERVQRAMEECKYKYNSLARGIVTKRTNTIGLILPTITNPIFAESTKGVQDYLNDHAYQVVLGSTDYDHKKEVKLIQVFREMRVDGILITTTDLKSRELQDMLEDEFPFVLLYSTVREGPLSSVGVDNHLGGYRATEHLIQMGHTRIAMLAGTFSFSDKSYHRWNGYRECLLANGIKYDPKFLIQSPYELEKGKEGIKQLLQRKNPPTAVFCSNDYLAIGALKGAHEMGVHVPDDMSIVGFDDIALASYIQPGLNTIRQPAYQMGAEGAAILLQRISSPSDKSTHRLLDSELVVRNSVAKYQPSDMDGNGNR